MYCLDWESKYFEVVGPHRDPVISEGVQILQQNSGLGGPNTLTYFDQGELSQGGPFFFLTALLLLAFSLLVCTNVINLVFGTHRLASTCDHFFDHTETCYCCMNDQ